MLETIFKAIEADKRWRDNPLVVHIKPFATSLIEDEYAKNNMQSKLWSLVGFGEWLRRGGLGVTNVDERLIKTFINGR